MSPPNLSQGWFFLVTKQGEQLAAGQTGELNFYPGRSCSETMIERETQKS